MIRNIHESEVFTILYEANVTSDFSILKNPKSPFDLASVDQDLCIAWPLLFPSPFMNHRVS